MSEWQGTARKVVETVRRSKTTLVRLECGHDRSIGGNWIDHSGMCGDAHLLMYYPCHDGHCGKWQ